MNTSIDVRRTAKIVLVGNYAPDRQESMQRFALVLFDQLQTRQIEVEILRPEPFAARNLQTHHGIGKWLSYIDKYVLFPRRLALRVRQLAGTRFVVHICDHSNAPYARRLVSSPHLVTCNDLIAIRSALGEFPKNPTRWTGKQLQKMILAGLNNARYVVAISEATRQDVLRLAQLSLSRVDMIYMGLNYPYHPMPADEARTSLAGLFSHRDPVLHPDGCFPPSFLLHVGGNQWYKNRLGLLRIYAALRRINPDCPSLVLAGAPLPLEIIRFIADQGLNGSVRIIEAARNEDLRALYSAALCVVFPSTAEGFGWPIAEAQACGCPVITTGRAPMTEVGGAAASYIDPADVEASAVEINRLLKESPDERTARVRLGVANAGRFSTSGMIDKYVAIYEKLIGEPL